MEAPRVPRWIAAGLGLVTVLLVLASPASADMHAACDTQNPETEGAFGPAGYANVGLFRNPEAGGFTYGGGVYCPGAVVTFESVTVTQEGPGVVVAATSGDAPCTAGPASPCLISDAVGRADLAPGSYVVEMLFDADDPNTDGLEYDDTVRRQTFTYLGAGTPILTCPDAGYVHANPPVCP